MTVEELIEELKQLKPHWIIKPDVTVNYDGHGEVSLYPIRQEDRDEYDYDE